MTNNTLKFILLIALWIGSQSCALFAQITVRADRPTARYEQGEQMEFEVTSLETSSATYEIFHDQYTAPLATGTLDLIENQQARIPFQLNYAGSVFCKVTAGGFANYGGATFSPHAIRPLAEEPADFDAFWDALKAESAAIPLDPQLTFLSSSEYANIYRLNLANLDGRRVYAYVSIPYGDGNFPAFITFPSFGNNADLVQPELTLPQRSGAISIALSVLNTEPDQDDPAGYSPNDITQAEGIFYKYALIGAVRMIDWLFTRPEFNQQNLGAVGVSQGGGLATMVAGLDARVNLLAASNPSHGQNVGFEAGRATPFPYYIVTANLRDDAETAVPQTFDAVRYYDAIHFAKRYKGPALMLTGYRDDVNPPETVYAIINALSGSKIVVHSRELNHLENPDEYWLGRLDFIRRYFPETLNAPWMFTPTTTGYAADAGDDVTLDNPDSPLTVRGTIEQNGVFIDSLPVRWHQVSGPGIANFDNPTAAMTSVQFSQAGTYVLSFSAYDDVTVGEQGRFYTITDYVQIQAGDPNVDTTAPVVELSTESDEVADAFVVEINLSEPVEALDKSDFELTNATAVALTGAGLNFGLRVLPQANGIVTVQLPAGSVFDQAGNANLASNLVRVRFDMSSTINEVATGKLHLAPNPVVNTLQLDWSTEIDIEQISLFSATGTLVQAVVPSPQMRQWIWPVENLPAGIYYVVWQQSTGEKWSQRLVKI